MEEDRSTNVYAPPTAVVADPGGPAGRSGEFYVVAPRKFNLLFYLTLGLYQLYWFYMHWARYRRHSGETLWPVARTIFSIFYTHALTRRIDAALQNRGAVFAWAPGATAGAYVIAQVISTLMERLSWREIGSPFTDLLSLGMLLPLGLILLRIQRAANAACGDPAGESNRRLTLANLAWLAFGCLLWAMILLGMATYVVPEEAWAVP